MLKMNTWYRFGDLEKEAKLYLVEAFLDGEQVIVSTVNPNENLITSSRLIGANFQNMYYYKIIKKIPTINWDMIKKEFKYLAIDEDGGIYLYQKEPVADHSDGTWEVSDYSLSMVLVVEPELMTEEFFTRGDVEWYNSLIVRPEEVEEEYEEASTEDSFIEWYKNEG